MNRKKTRICINFGHRQITIAYIIIDVNFCVWNFTPDENFGKQQFYMFKKLKIFRFCNNEDQIWKLETEIAGKAREERREWEGGREERSGRENLF